MVTSAEEPTMLPPPLPSPTDGESSKPSIAPKAAGVKEKEKGSRQSFSCAECRRLKLKCSRVWPCTSCEKRGCAQICPNGEMRTGKGKRLILADTEELHHRISLLEVALAQAHGKHSTAPHPLLSSAYLFAPRDTPSSRTNPYPRVKPFEAGLQVMDEEDDTVDSAFGTLTIGTEGQARFVGSFAGSEYLRVEADSEGGSDRSSPAQSGARFGEARLATPPASARGEFPRLATAPTRAAYAEGGVALLDSLLPGGAGVVDDIERLREQLPDWEREGRELVASYWDNVNWMYQMVPRSIFDNDYLLNAYDSETVPNPHKLACIFLIMALGVMFDLNRMPFDPRGERLFLLGRASLNLVGLERASPATVQAMHLCGTYILNDKHGNGGEIFWPVLGSAIKVAQGLGLHRDGAAFGLSELEIEERRLVWWELVTYDRLQAMCFGRPYGISNRTMDTKFPESEVVLPDTDGYHHAKFRTVVLMEKVIDVQTQTTPVSYALIRQLDDEFIEFKKNLPESLMPNTPVQDLPLDRLIHPHVVIHRLGIRLLVAQSRLLLNRAFFARALKDNPDDPSRSKHGASFIALYESTQEIVMLVKQLVIYHPSLIARWWFFWFHAFSSAVCLAAIAIRAPNCAFASPAFHGMTIVCDISAAAREGCRAKKGLPILVRLRKRAQDALLAASARSRKNKGADSMGTSPEEDDLSHLVSAAKLRRVGSSPPTQRARLGHTPSSSTGAPANIEELSPTAPSVATSTTLAEPQGHEGAVPAFPHENFAATPAPVGDIGIQRPSSPGSAMAEQILLQRIGPTMGGFNWPAEPLMHEQRYYTGNIGPFGLTGVSPTLNTDPVYGLGSQSQPIPGGAGVSMDDMDMDMSMALGVGLGMGIGVGGGMESTPSGQGGVGVGGLAGTGQGAAYGDQEGIQFDFDTLLNGMTGGGAGYE